MHKKNDAGFTLLEVMVAITIFAVIGLGCWQALSSAIASHERLEVRAQQLRELQRAFWLISRDLNSIVDRPIRDNSGYKEPALTSLSANYTIQFTHGGWPNPAQTSRSELQRVAYSIEPNGDGNDSLIRHYWSSLDRSPRTEAIQQTLLDHVTYFEIEYIDQTGKHWFYWPMDNDRDENQAAIPSGIIFKIGTETFGDIERIYALRDLERGPG